MLNLVMWNAQSLGGKAVMLENIVVDFLPDFMLVTESWIDVDENVTFHWPLGYRVENIGRDERRGGGVAWLIKNKYRIVEKRYSEPNLPVEWLALKIDLGRGEFIWLVGCYVPSGQVRWNSDFVDDFVGEKTVVCGDFNAKGPSLPYKKQIYNSSGRELREIIQAKKFVLNGPFVPTHKLGGTLDLIFSSHAIFQLVGDITVGDYYSSDHKVVASSLDVSAVQNPESRFDFSRAKWPVFQKLVEKTLSCVEFPRLATPADVENLSTIASSCLLNAASVAIPRVPRPKVRSWRSNKEIAQTIKERHRYQRLRESTGIPMFGYLANRAHDKFKELVKAAEEKALHDELRQIEKARRCDTRKFFKMVDRVSKNGGRNSRGVRNLVKDGVVASTDAEKAEMLKTHLEGQFQNRLVKSNDPRVEEKHEEVRKFMELRSGELESHVSAPCVGRLALTKAEVREAVKRLKLKAPGIDGVHNMLIKKAGQQFENFLRKLFNMSLSVGYVPQCWKVAVVVPLPRPGKDLSSVGGYRPVSLLPVIGKLLETILASRLVNLLSTHGILPRCQSAFRPGHCTTDQTFTLAQLGSLARARKEVLVAAFIDFEGAFNAVWHHGLRFKLANCKPIPTELVRWLSSFLHGRRFKVKVGGDFSSEAVIEAGVPQGSALSPILFSLFTHDLPEPGGGPGDARCLMYADDVTAVASACWPGLAAARVQRRIRAFQRWSETWKMPVNPAKCQVLVVGSCRTDVRIYMNGQTIPKVNSTKYLGVTFDNRMNFEAHIDSIVEKANVRMAVLKKLSFKTSISTNTKLVLFKALIRPLFEYSCTAFLAAPEKQLRKLQVLQNRALRLCLNFTMFDNIRSTLLHSILKMPTVYERFVELSARFGNRALNQVGPVSRLIQDNRGQKDAEFTPLAKFEKSIAFGPAIL